MMNGEKRITPEEKLLNIIESPGAARKIGTRRKFKVQGFLSGWKSVLSDKINFQKISLRDINKLLLSATVIATLIFVVYFIKEERHLRIKFDDLSKGNIKGEEIWGKQKDISNISSYLADTEKNNPFHILPFGRGPKSIKQIQKSEFKLVGIIWSDTPQAIIEDSLSKKTYVVYEGDTIGESKVGKISKNETILLTKDGKKTLR